MSYRLSRREFCISAALIAAGLVAGGCSNGDSNALEAPDVDKVPDFWPKELPETGAGTDSLGKKLGEIVQKPAESERQMVKDLEKMEGPKLDEAVDIIRYVYSRRYPDRSLVTNNSDVYKIDNKVLSRMGETDHSAASGNLPFVIFDDDMSINYGLRPGIYWHKPQFGGEVGDVSDLAHEFVHLWFGFPAEDEVLNSGGSLLGHFSPYTGSMAVEYYLRTGNVAVDGDYHALKTLLDGVPGIVDSNLKTGENIK